MYIYTYIYKNQSQIDQSTKNGMFNSEGRLTSGPSEKEKDGRGREEGKRIRKL